MQECNVIRALCKNEDGHHHSRWQRGTLKSTSMSRHVLATPLEVVKGHTALKAEFAPVSFCGAFAAKGKHQGKAGQQAVWTMSGHGDFFIAPPLHFYSDDLSWTGAAGLDSS